ncbi:hypothetical protein BDV32DRAFT_117763, partial [Aspergillus pseudonomiae]
MRDTCHLAVNLPSGISCGLLHRGDGRMSSAPDETEMARTGVPKAQRISRDGRGPSGHVLRKPAGKKKAWLVTHGWRMVVIF